MKIEKVVGREILDSRGNPTVEVDVHLASGAFGRAAVPSGASTGENEAIELRDGDKNRYGGKGVLRAVDNVNKVIAPAILGMSALNQREIDHKLLDLDGTKTKANLGANAMLGVSLAVAKAAANYLDLPLYRYIGGINAKKMPLPMMNILNGGWHADNTVDLQEFMIAPVGADSFKHCLEMSAEIYHTLKRVLHENGLSNGVGDEGGFAPNLATSAQVLDYLVLAIKEAGYKPYEDVKIAIDAAASELYDETSGLYYFPGESRMAGREIYRNSEEMVQYYEDLIGKYPIYSIEDGLDENDMKGWKVLTFRLGEKVQLVGDDLFVTNTKRLDAGIKLHCGNAILVKVNQIGTLSEAFEAVEMAHKNGYKAVISHRSGETEDTTIADIAVALNAGQIKTGAPCRSDRVAKYNRLLAMEEELKDAAAYMEPFHKI